MLEVRVYEAASLQLQLILPYQTAKTLQKILPSLILYPIVNNQSLATVASPALRQMVYWVRFFTKPVWAVRQSDALSMKKFGKTIL